VGTETSPIPLEDIPLVYREHYHEIRPKNPEMVDTYIRHTKIGDPILDPVMEELQELEPAEIHNWVRAGVEQDDEVFAKAPIALREFMREAEEVPSWVDFDLHRTASMAFFRNAERILPAFAAASGVEGFSTLVSRSFATTGRVTGLGDHALKRLKQNMRHFLEVYYPGQGLARENDGWRSTVRIRFIHSRLRLMMDKSDDWNNEDWGRPLSMAHIGGISLYTFSLRSFYYARMLGAEVSREEEEAIANTWRYVGYLLGVADEMLFTNPDNAKEMFELGHSLEPKSTDIIAPEVAHAAIKATPKLSGFEGKKAEKFEKFAYKLSRAMIGDELADLLQYPKNATVGVLALFRMQLRFRHIVKRKSAAFAEFFGELFKVMQYDKGGISYRMPTNVRDEQSEPW